MRTSLIIILSVLFPVAGSVCAAATAPLPAIDPPVSSIGSYRVHWQYEGIGPGTEFELVESVSPDFRESRVVYRGPDRSTVMSGRADGDYFYRLRISDGIDVSEWGASATVEVSHHPLGRAIAFFAAGALVFLATLALIVTGSRRERS